MQKRLVLLVLLALVAIGGAGCRLLGVGEQVDGSRAEVEQVVYSLAAAAELQDFEEIASHLGGAVHITLPGIVPLSAGPVNAIQFADQLESLLGQVQIEALEIVLSSIKIQGDTATVEGGFKIDYRDAAESLIRLVGSGRLNLEYDAGRWLVTAVQVIEVDETILEPGKPKDPPEPGDPQDPEDPEEPGEPGAPDDPDEGDKPGEPEEPDVPGLPEPPPGVPGYFFDRCEYLVLGFQGEQVAALQESLKYLGYYTGRVDGDFGPMTDRAVRKFQSDKKLYVDGEAGPKTYAEINKALAAKGGYYLCGVADTQADAGPTMLTRTALRKGTAFESPVLIYESPNPGPTLMFVGCIHGNERSGHIALTEAIDRGITISRGRVVIVPAFNKIACEQNRRTLSRSGSALSGKDFNRMFPVGSSPTYLIAREMWDLIKAQPNLKFVVDFHDGFINSLGNTLIHTRQSEAGRVMRKIRDALNEIRPKGARGPAWRAFTEPISGSLTRKVGRDLGIPAVEVELSGRSPGDPISLRKQYAWRFIRMLGHEYGIAIGF